MNTLSVVDSGVVGETVFVLLPLPLVLRDSDGIFPTGSLERLAVSDFRGDVEPSAKATPFEEFSVKKMILTKKVEIRSKKNHFSRTCYFDS